MISEEKFAAVIETFRMHKAYMSCLLGNIGDDYTFSLVQEIYNGLLEGFMAATVNQELDGYFDLYDSLEEDWLAFSAFDTMDGFINYGYTYTAELEAGPEDLDDEWYQNPTPLISSEGILLNNIHDFYNYWVLFKTPENPIYKKVSYSSVDADELARRYIQSVRKQCFPDDYFII